MTNQRKNKTPLNKKQHTRNNNSKPKSLLCLPSGNSNSSNNILKKSIKNLFQYLTTLFIIRPIHKFSKKSMDEHDKGKINAHVAS